VVLMPRWFLKLFCRQLSQVQKMDFEGPEKLTFLFDPPNLCRQPPLNPKNGVNTCKIAAHKFTRRIQY
jgi:hypothetical protein